MKVEQVIFFFFRILVLWACFSLLSSSLLAIEEDENTSFSVMPSTALRLTTHEEPEEVDFTGNSLCTYLHTCFPSSSLSFNVPSFFYGRRRR